VIFRNGFPELLRRSVTRRVPRDIEVQDPARRMLNHDECIKHLESRGHCGEEVAGHATVSVISDE
jgi:hypothetical protein